MSENQLFRIAFVNQNQVFEMYAKKVFQSDLFGFVVAEEFVFGEHSSIVVDPAEEKLKSEFANVKRSHIPMHAVIRIDQVERRGTAKIFAIDKETGDSSRTTRLYTPEK